MSSQALPKIALQVENLIVRYPQQTGCEGVNFCAAPGERIAVIGPNGAGKSTLFKAIVGLHPIYEGRVSLDTTTPDKFKFARISYVPQSEAVDWNFPASVWDAVMMVRTRHIGYILPPRPRDRQAVKKALTQVELWPLRNRQIGQLSGGQRRRVFIARALAQEARVVLMDEPFAGVDASVETEVFAILDILREQNITVLIATHNLSQARQRYDKVLMLNRHQIAYGPADEVFTPDNLAQTFGAGITLWQGEQEFVLFSDKPCHDHDDGHDHAMVS
jgi:ABC-type Mn2+/Zn2+ transport system ATPase subunit